MKDHNAAIIEAISNMPEEIALARPRTKKVGNVGAGEFGKRLAQARCARGLSQVELANAVQMYQSDISDFERGSKWPETKTLIALASVLHVSVDKLLGTKEVKDSSQPVESRSVLRRLRHIETLPKRDRQALLRTLDNILAGVSHHKAHAT